VTRRDAVAALLLPLCMVTTFVASAPWLRAFPPGTVAPLLVGAAVVSVAVPWLAVRLAPRASALWSMGASFVLFVLFTLALVVRQPSLADLVRGFVHGPTLLLSETLPITAPRWVMVAPVALCWLIGGIASELLIRTRRSQAAAAVWPAGFVLAFIATAGGAGNDTLSAALLVVAEGSLLFCHRWLSDVALAEPGRSDDGRLAELPARSLVLGSVSLIVVVGLSALLIPLTPHLEGVPTVPARTPPLSSVPAVSPLTAVATLRRDHDPSTTLFTVRVSRSVPGYIAVANLDVYDGGGWDLPHVFTPSGGEVAQPLVATATQSGALAQQRYVIEHPLSFPWMPYIDRPLAVSGLAVGDDRNSGMVVPPAPLQAATIYWVTSRAATKTLPSLVAETHPIASSIPADASLPPGESGNLRGILELLESDTGVRPTATLGYLQYLAHYFRTKYGLTPSSVTPTTGAPGDFGLSYADVVNQISGLGRGEGTPEQFATLYALLARDLGVPARVVAGFRVSNHLASGTMLQPGVVYDVTKREAWTWVEIPVAGVGWVAIDPSPSKRGAPAVTARSAPTTTSTLPRQSTAQPNPGNVGHRVAPRVHVRLPVPPSGFPWPVVAPILAAVAVLLVVAIPGARRWLRRRRRQRGAPRQRVIGAWQETLDNLTELEHLRLDPLTSAEVVEATRSSVGQAAAEPVGSLARLADLAIFSPDTAFDEADAARAWRTQATARKAVTDTMEPIERLRASVRVAPGPYRRRN